MCCCSVPCIQGTQPLTGAHTSCGVLVLLTLHTVICSCCGYLLRIYISMISGYLVLVSSYCICTPDGALCTLSIVEVYSHVLLCPLYTGYTAPYGSTY